MGGLEGMGQMKKTNLVFKLFLTRFVVRCTNPQRNMKITLIVNFILA